MKIMLFLFSIKRRNLEDIQFEVKHTLNITLGPNCNDPGDPVCTHTMYGETEEELIENAKKHGIKVHSYTEESLNGETTKNLEHFRKVIKTS